MSSWFQRFGWAEVGRGLLVGAYPTDSADVEVIADAGADRLYNLCQDAEYDEGQRDAVSRALEGAGISEDRLPLEDYGGLPPEVLDRSVREVREAIAEGDTVYLHCRAGWQRSATVAAAVIALEEDLEITEALRVLGERKPSAEPMAHQRADLFEWWRARGERP